VPNPNPTLKTLSDLAGQLNGAVLMGHSQSGPFPLALTLLNPKAAKGLVLVEPVAVQRITPPSRSKRLRPYQSWPYSVTIATRQQGSRRGPRGKSLSNSYQALIGQINAAGGQAEMLNPPDRGIRGNSHMILQDKNNLQIADLILQWIDKRVSKRRSGHR
jgi:pimeloyl-ACP methyl ester carboxylesterase